MSALKVKWNVERVRNVVGQGGALGLAKAAHVIAHESLKQVPIADGTLERSQEVSVQGEVATISYDTPYAVRWHEEDANFQRGRKKKYLEDPVNDPANWAAVTRALADEIKLE